MHGFILSNIATDAKSIIEFGMKLLIHIQTSTVEILKWISNLPHTFL